jgi:hypothetical protein
MFNRNTPVNVQHMHNNYMGSVSPATTNTVGERYRSVGSLASGTTANGGGASSMLNDDAINTILMNLSARAISAEERTQLLTEVAQSINNINDDIDELIRYLQYKCAQITI